MTNTTKKPTQKPVTGSTENRQTFSEEERAAMRERARELRDSSDGDRAVFAALAKMPEPDRTMGKRVHAIIKASAPSLMPKTWYGMPAYANKDGKVVCFFQNASKFKYRYSTLGFQDAANLDDGMMWPTSYALKKLTAADEKKIGALVKKATG